MDTLSRHKCLVYSGAPSRHLRAIAAAARDMLNHNYRCIYFNSKPMLAGLRSYLAAEGVDVESAVGTGALLLSADHDHLVDGGFDVDAMIALLEHELNQALQSGYSGLWASGDMTWELGPERDFEKLLEYEWRLEQFLRQHPQVCGICQYHAESLPPDAIRQAVRTHASIFVNETLSLMNPHYIESGHLLKDEPSSSSLDDFVGRLLQMQEEVRQN